MYVAITRAKKELVLTHAKSRFVFGDFQMQMPSRFLKELPAGEIDSEEVFSADNFSYVRRNDSASSQMYSAPAQVRKIASPASKMEDGISGKRVFHQKFGYGKVLNMDGNKLEIAFEKSGTKIVMKDFIALA